MIFFPFQFFLREGVSSNRLLALGNAYKDVFETLRSLDDLVVAWPQLLAGEFHKLSRENASTGGTKSAYKCESNGEVKRTRQRSCQPASANAI